MSLVDLIEIIKKNVKSSYKCKYVDKEKLIRNIANFGANIGSQGIVSKSGEYSKFSVEFLSKVKPLFTDYRIIKALELLENEDYNGIIRTLEIDEDYSKYGKNIIFHIIYNWFKINNIDIKLLLNISNFNTEYNNENLNESEAIKRLKLMRHDAIICPIKIIGIGNSLKGNSVVPDNWLGREFENACKLHQEMGQLDWRKNKPEVNFCCIYSMSLVNNNQWVNKNDLLNTHMVFNNLIIITCLLNNDRIKTNIIFNEKPNIISHNHDTMYYYDNKKDLLLCVSKTIFKDNVKYIKNDQVSILVSRLQKSFRRGPESSKILSSTIDQLNNAPYYNLPDQHYVKVSGTRQLLWRSYISIIEDVCGYYHSKIYDLQDLFVLSLICQINPDLQLKEIYVSQIKTTLLNVQNIKKSWSWREGNLVSSNKFKTYGLNCDSEPSLRMIDSMILALNFMPMMSGDRVMLSKCVNYLAENNYNYNLINYQNDDYFLDKSVKDVEQKVLLSSIDMHCCPNILLSLQGSIPFLPNNEYSTQNLSSFIWNNSSKFNMRYSKNILLKGKEKDILDTLQVIQQNLLNKPEPKNIKNIDFKKNCYAEIIKDKNILDEISRLAFILIFGQKIRLPNEGKNKPSLEIILAGDKIKPCRVKKYSSEKYLYLEDKERYDGEKRYVLYISNGLNIELPLPPKGYKWLIDKKVKIKARLIESDETNLTNKIDFYVNNIKIQPFDAAIFLESIGKYVEINLEDHFIKELIDNALYRKKTINGLELNMTMRNVGIIRNKLDDHRVFKLVDILYDNQLKDVYIQLYTKLQTDNVVEIGPIDRKGNKTHKSINYKHEGVYWRLLNLLFMLFPFAIQLKNDFKFELNYLDPSYYNMLHLLENIIYCENKTNNIKKSEENETIIKTKLWDHQDKSVKKIFNSMINSKCKKGFGDASKMGAGKTLTALAIISKLYNFNLNNKINSHNGFLILVPNVQLYKTWEDEIIKHTNGFNIIFQNANGTLTTDILCNSIVISTMGRIREHPINCPWILLVIDECLTVQNKEALQTEEALRQATASQYNCILLSATFFRTRFDKLFYMLKMLKTGIPEKLEYLDTILSESLVCNIHDDNRKWVVNITKKELDKKIKFNYDNIIKSNINDGYEKVYILLNKFIHEFFNYSDYFKQKINEIEKDRISAKILVYAKSKDEADNIASENISRYPDISKKHVVVTYSEGAYGLNNLISFNTILTRPPNPDLLPQMKGRLDRNGQTSDILYLEYILLKNTIEEALLIKLDIANNFHNSHIIPLAEFYKIAVSCNSIN